MIRDNKSDEILSVSFILPTLNADKKIEKCLKSIYEQKYPKTKVEIIIIDGGSSDDTIEIAKKYNCKILYNSKKRTDPGTFLGLMTSNSDIKFIVNADNELPREDWIQLMTKPFKENDDVYGVFTKTIKNNQMNAITRYWVCLHDHHPLNWFIGKKVINPDRMRESYGIIKETPRYTILNFNTLEYPLLLFGQGFGAKKGFINDKTAFEHVNIIIEMIRNGLKIAYVPKAGIYHYTLDSFKHFVRKFHFRIVDRIGTEEYGYRSRIKIFTKQRKIRQYLWLLYSTTLILPLVDSIKGWLKDRDFAWFYHPIACFTFTILIMISFIEYIYERVKIYFIRIA